MYFIPMKNRKEFPKALKEFVREISMPVVLVFDMSVEQISGNVKKLPGNMNLTLKMLERMTQYAILAELKYWVDKRGSTKKYERF